MSGSRPRLIVASVSARLLAEAAVREGYEALALDQFGDLDTRRVAAWRPLDREHLLAALGEGGAIGWIAGSGFEAEPELLAEGAALLPLLGTAPGEVAKLRDAQVFFATLDRLGIPHPPWSREPRPGWLLKDGGGCGGWHIRVAEAGETAPSPRHYFQQRIEAGLPMSATFVANGSAARVLGFNEQLSRPFGFLGIVGPVPLPPVPRAEIDGIVQSLAAAFRLRGLCSLDFIRTSESTCTVLEVNARPPASLALYPGALRWHLRACLDGELPPAPAPDRVRGLEIVFARQAVTVGDLAGDRVHDLPQPGSRFAAGEPVCSVSAEGASAALVRHRLAGARDALLDSLESCHA
ncbi:ATP-grasp domain-containing protein [Pelomonas sp. KK5]|uniref:ATP-grasp domain-containing protein n=1 Tax=Pelomonas sp. KK5 TaxID=1855730 RepID=UPI00097CA66C|nr:ATP-grasp domain-containing protein [Pelomonas sp. KK5]